MDFKTAFLQGKQIEREVFIKPPKEPPKCLTDNKNLYKTSGTSHVLAERRLEIEMAVLRDMIDKQEVTMEWTQTENQLGDILTKKGVNNNQLREVISRGHF